MRSSPKRMVDRSNELWPLRVVETDLAHPAYTIACDEALLLARAQGLAPDTLHLYRRSRPTVSLGYFQRAEGCVDLRLADEMGISVVRRLSGGSAIYTDPGQMIYCIVLSEDLVPEAPLESYPMICEGVVKALSSFGLLAEWKPLNDVLVNGRKISGSAQARKRGVVVQHGTVLVDTDLELMLRLLLPQKGKRWRARSELTTLRDELGKAPSMRSVRSALIEGFSKELGRKMVRGTFTSEEHELIRDRMRNHQGSSGPSSPGSLE
jgi:lipoate-protein ligase A